MINGCKWIHSKKQLFILCAVTLLFSSITCNADDLVVSQTGQSKWNKVFEFGPISAEPPTWCGKTAIVIKAWDWITEKGGIVYLDVVNKTTNWITRDPLFKEPSCNYDGSLIFMYKMRNDPKLEEGHASDGMWSYDLNTGKSQRIGNVSTNQIRCPASPSENIFAVIASEKKYLQNLKITLPEWRILKFPMSSHEVSVGSQWSSDGTYLLLPLKGKNKYDDLQFYDTNGVLLRSISTEAFQLSSGGASSLIAKKDGLYWFTSAGHLRRFSVDTGKLDQLSFQVSISKKKIFTFDISPDQDILYAKSNDNDELWIASIIENKTYPIGKTGMFPVFSSTGKYLAFIHRNEKGQYAIVALERQ